MFILCLCFAEVTGQCTDDQVSIYITVILFRSGDHLRAMAKNSHNRFIFEDGSESILADNP